MENGPIAVGDPLTGSSLPGVAMKAARAGRIIGYALAGTHQAGQVLALVQPGYFVPDDEAAVSAEAAALPAPSLAQNDGSLPWLVGLSLAVNLLLGAVLLVHLRKRA